MVTAIWIKELFLKKVDVTVQYYAMEKRSVGYRSLPTSIPGRYRRDGTANLTDTILHGFALTNPQHNVNTSHLRIG
jgi:hypothetical protein